MTRNKKKRARPEAKFSESEGSENSDTETEITMSEDEVKKFMCLDPDEKLLHIFTKLGVLNEIRGSVKGMKKKIEMVESSVKKLEDKWSETDLRLKQMEYKAINQEAQARRMNLIFFGVTEGKNTQEDLHKSLKKAYGDKAFSVEKVLRLGKPPDGGIDDKSDDEAANGDQQSQMSSGSGTQSTSGRMKKTKPRPLLATFTKNSDIQDILKSSKQLKNQGVTVSKDLPQEIRNARETLWPQLKEAKTANRDAYIAFPAKLVIDKKVVADRFPDWHTVLGHSTKK